MVCAQASRSTPRQCPSLMSAAFCTMLLSVMKRISHKSGVVVHSCQLNPGRLSSSPAWAIQQEEAWLKTRTKINIDDASWSPGMPELDSLRPWYLEIWLPGGSSVEDRKLHRQIAVPMGRDIKVLAFC